MFPELTYHVEKAVVIALHVIWIAGAADALLHIIFAVRLMTIIGMP
jgi:hypothetical protein